jgi:outer membrane protein assembly factor BamB
MPSTTRRALLGAVAAGSVAALAGCSSSCPDSGEPEPDALVGTSPGDTPFDEAPDTDWPAPRNDVANTGYAPDATLPEAPLGVRWEASLPTRERESTYDRASSPVVVGDRVVVATGGGVSALGFRDGTDAWRAEGVAPNTTTVTQSYDEEFVTPVVGGETVYVGGTEALVALDLADGSERWRYEAASRFRTPAVDGGAVFVDSDAGFVALDADDGSELWTADPGVETGLPAVADGAVVVAGRETVALDAATGEVRWATDSQSDHYPVAADGTVYLGTYEGLAAVDLASGETRWTFDRGSGRSLSAPVVADDTLYVVEQPGEAGDATFALDRTEGPPEPRWCSDVGEGAVTAATPDRALGLLPDGSPGDGSGTVQMVAFDEQLGNAHWGLPGSNRLVAPAVVDGAVLVVDRLGRVKALGEV